MYWNLIPGHQANFAGVEPGGDHLNVSVKVTSQVKVMPDGIPTRVVNDTVVNAESGALKEIAIDYFAICKDTNSVFYFGEKTAEYENGKIANTTRTWQHGVDGAHAGVAMPGVNLLGAQYYQEVAPKVALDQGQTVSVTDNNNTKLCNNNCLKVKETTPFEPGRQNICTNCRFSVRQWFETSTKIALDKTKRCSFSLYLSHSKHL